MYLETDEARKKARRQHNLGTVYGFLAYAVIVSPGFVFPDSLWFPGLTVAGVIAWAGVFVRQAIKADKVLDRYVECSCEIHMSPDDRSASFRIIKADVPKAERLN